MNISSVRTNINKLGCQSQKRNFRSSPKCFSLYLCRLPRAPSSLVFLKPFVTLCSDAVEKFKSWAGAVRGELEGVNLTEFYTKAHCWDQCLQTCVTGCYFLLPKINRLLFKPLIVEWMIQINASKHKLSYELLVGSIFCHRICSGIKRYTFVEVYGYTLWNIVVTRTQTD